ncbi:MAG TPA: Fur family transcriptional regulator [Syntrophales bacterium]|nr:Fur family transcriptional regulator [Syntrophales bacterium]
MIEQLKAAGLKVTPQRKAIIEGLMEIGHLHPSIPAIDAAARKRFPGLSLSTTYATVNELNRLGIIKLLGFEGGESRCDMNPEEHIHLICDRCGELTDYDLPFSIDREYMASKTGFTITDSRLEYHGLCKRCIEKELVPFETPVRIDKPGRSRAS